MEWIVDKLWPYARIIYAFVASVLFWFGVGGGGRFSTAIFGILSWLSLEKPRHVVAYQEWIEVGQRSEVIGFACAVLAIIMVALLAAYANNGMKVDKTLGAPTALLASACYGEVTQVSWPWPHFLLVAAAVTIGSGLHARRYKGSGHIGDIYFAKAWFEAGLGFLLFLAFFFNFRSESSKRGKVPEPSEEAD